MQALLVAATSFEIAPTLNFLEERQNLRHHFIPVITGVGILAATYQLTTAIELHKPALVIQAGIGGSLHPSIIGEVVAISSDSVTDLGVWEGDNYKTVFDLGFSKSDAFPFNNSRLVNPYRSLQRRAGLPLCEGNTVNEITTSAKQIARLKKQHRQVVESMEGAALHFVCLMKNIPFIQLRAISNELGVRDKSKWELSLAIQKLNEQLLVLLNKLEDCNEDDVRI